MSKPSLVVTIGGELVLIQAGSFGVTGAIGERSTCSFVVIDSDRSKTYQKGQPVIAWGEDHSRLFGGVIESATYTLDAPSGGGRLHDIECVDWHYLADKRIVAASYTDMLAGDIVRDLVQKYLAAEGVTTTESDSDTIFHSEWFPAEWTVDGDFVQDGELVREAVFNYIPVSQALDSLAEKSGFWWTIDAYKRLHFLPRTAKKARRKLVRADARKGSIRVNHGNAKYRNRQYIKGGMDITDPQVERFPGDGETQSFTLGFPLAKVPTITLNGVAQTVGIKGKDSGFQWYWAKGDPVITQEKDDTPLTASDTLEVEYQGEFPIVFLSFDSAAIEDRKAVEGGGTGLVEVVDDAPDLTSRESAGDLANKKLREFSTIGRKVSFVTWKPGIEPGMLLTIDLPEYGVNNVEMLVDMVSIRHDDGVVWYSVQAVEGPSMGSWAKMFEALARKATPFVIRENIREDQILVILETFSRTWLETDQPNIFRQLFPGPTVFPGPSLFPQFVDGTEVRYLAWYDETGELGRKQITQRDGSKESGQIKTTTIIGPGEANGQITHLGWWGGSTATEEPGSGIEVDKQPYDHVKTELEQLQIVKTDTKGW